MKKEAANMKNILRLAAAMAFLSSALASPAKAQSLNPAQVAMASSVQSSLDPITVVPFDFDPNKSNLVRARWLTGIGCPTSVTVFDFSGSPTTVAEPACPNGDSKDKQNEGLLLVKTGPSVENFASAGAKLEGVKGKVLTELGYDLRKPGTTNTDPRGSHCGAGAPRFNVATSNGFFFVGCNSPPPTVTSGTAWQRLRWSPVMGFSSACTVPPGGPCPITGTVDSITIIFDEGTDTGPDDFGLAVIDNIDVNGTLVGKGPGS